MARLGRFLRFQGRPLGALDDLLQASLLQVFAACHEMLQALRERLEYLMDGAALSEEGAGEPDQEAPVLRLELACELTREEVVQGLVHGRALAGVGEEPPEGAEGAAGRAVADYIHAEEKLLEDGSPRGAILEDSLAQVAVQLVELVAHPAKVADQGIGEGDNFARLLVCLVRRQHADLAALDGLYLLVDTIALFQKPRDAPVRIRIGRLRKVDERIDHQGQAALRGGGIWRIEALDKADGARRSRRELVLLLGLAGQEPALEKAAREPLGDVVLSALREIRTCASKRLKVIRDPFVQDGCSEALVGVLKIRLQDRKRVRRVGGGKKPPQRLIS